MRRVAGYGTDVGPGRLLRALAAGDDESYVRTPIFIATHCYLGGRSGPLGQRYMVRPLGRQPSDLGAQAERSHKSARLLLLVRSLSRPTRIRPETEGLPETSGIMFAPARRRQQA